MEIIKHQLISTKVESTLPYITKTIVSSLTTASSVLTISKRSPQVFIPFPACQSLVQTFYTLNFLRDRKCSSLCRMYETFLRLHSSFNPPASCPSISIVSMDCSRYVHVSRPHDGVPKRQHSWLPRHVPLQAGHELQGEEVRGCGDGRYPSRLNLIY